MKDVLASCRNTCWLIAAIIGVIIALYTFGFAHRGFLAALVLGAFSTYFIGNIAIWLFCEEPKSALPETTHLADPALATPSPTDDSAPQVEDTVVSPEQEADIADAGGDVAANTVAENSVSEQDAPSAEEKTVTTPEVVDQDFDKDGVVEGAGEGVKPQSLTVARGGQADDLKKIKGIGPKLEQLCFSLGFFHFDQIAAWSADEVAWVDANLKGFKGRVSRDAWVDQAKTLSGGGETEFSKRVGDGDVY